MCFVTVHRRPHPYWYPGSERTSAISLGKLKTNKLGDKCPGSQMTALWEVWKHFAKPTHARHTGRLPAMGVVKWDRCWGLKRPQWESENDASAARVRQLRDENTGGTGGSLFTTPDLLWNTFSLIGENRIGARCSFALKVGAEKRVQANSNMILWLTENSGEMWEFTCFTTMMSQGAPIPRPWTILQP